MCELAPALAQVACERVREELNGLLLGQAAGRMLRTAPQILAVVLPEITPMLGFEQHNKYHYLDV